MLLWHHMLVCTPVGFVHLILLLQARCCFSYQSCIRCCIAACLASLSDAGEVAVLVVNGTQLVHEVSSSSSSNSSNSSSNSSSSSTVLCH
jgi:hypothetical protein